MPNMAVPYRRSDYSLITLQDEIRRRFPGREQNKGFVTGYKHPANFSGHNADANGITHAYDIGVDIEGDGSGLRPADAEWLANYLRTECNPRFQYLIYNRRIAGNHTGWKWAPYNGASPHTDHIHISVVDLYWGDPCGVSPEVYDSRAPWGVYTVSTQSNEPEPTKPKPKPKKKRRRKSKPKSDLFWIVERGDTLAGISRYYYGTTRKWRKIARFNGIKRPEALQVGQRVYIPGPLYWRVEVGDTLKDPAKYFGIPDWRTVQRNAGIKDPQTLRAGQIIRVY